MGKAAGPKQLASSESSASETMTGPGVSHLLKGNRESAGPESEVSEPTSKVEKTAAPVTPPPAPFPLWYLFAADVLLVACALSLVFRSPATLTWRTVLFASIVTLLGAALAIAGVYIKEQQEGR